MGDMSGLSVRHLRLAVLVGGLASNGCGKSDPSGGGAGVDEPAYAAFFAGDVLATIELTIPPDCVDALAAAPYEYCEGSLRYVPGAEGATDLSLDGVGIRLKGSASFQDLDGKAAFKVKVDEYVAGQRIFGLRRLTLNNMWQDPGMVRERLGYHFYRAAGVPAPLCNHVRVLVNGEYYGLYANVQTLDDEFVEARYDPAPGNLYDTPNGVYFVDLLPEYRDTYVLETNQTANDTSDLGALIDAVNGPAATFFQDAGLQIDWQEWLAAAATQAVVADWDGYFGARNNYKLYHELDRDRFLVLPWGIDQTFGSGDQNGTDPRYQLHYAIDGSTSNRDPGVVFQNCRQDAACWEAYLDAVEAALAVWESVPLGQELDAMIAQIEAARQADTRRPYDDAQTQDSRDGLREFLEQRGNLVRAELATYGR
jgi:spore coat protein CotH